MAEYVVIANRLYHNVDGVRTRALRGDRLSGLSKADVERYLAAEAILPAKEADAKEAERQAKEHPATVAPAPGEASDPATAAVPESHDADVPASTVVPLRNSGFVERPANAADTDTWRKYAVESGQLTPDAADKLGRNQLREQLQ